MTNEMSVQQMTSSGSTRVELLTHDVIFEGSNQAPARTGWEKMA
jgi:hypothetical protein